MKKNQKSSANQESIEYLLGELKKITNREYGTSPVVVYIYKQA